jgi:hypothetical protein
VFHNAGTLLTDTSSGAGTVSARVGVSLHSPNYAASNAITITDAVNLYVQAPVASTNVTFTNNWAIYNQGNSYVNGNERIGTSLSVGTFTPSGTTGNITASGNLGVGTSSMATRLDVSNPLRSEFYGVDNSAPADVINVIGTGTTRALGTGAAITFTVPANTDGSNMWAQARIIGSGDNGSNGDANGALLLQTRSLYNPGGGGSWNWRTGITIRASGAIAFGNGGTAYGSSGQVLQSNGNAAPTWVNPSGLAASSIANFTAATSGNPLDATSPATLDAVGYVNANIPTSYGLGGSVGSQSDGGLYVAGYSTSWYHEIYGDFRTGGIAVRGKYSGTWQAWRNVPCISIQDTAPSIYNPGDLWWESDTGRLKVLYYDGSSSQWVDAVPVVNTSLFFSKSGGAISGPVSINGALDVTGNINATGEITAYYSDRRLKTNVLTIENALVKIKKLNGVTYRPNELAESFGLGKETDVVGLFADEVEQVLPQAVKPAPFDIDENGNSKSGENYKTIQYEKVVPLLVEAIKEQQSIIEAQQAKIDRLMKHLGLED